MNYMTHPLLVIGEDTGELPTQFMMNFYLLTNGNKMHIITRRFQFIGPGYPLWGIALAVVITLALAGLAFDYGIGDGIRAALCSPVR
jgi:hypothetical protein